MLAWNGSISSPSKTKHMLLQATLRDESPQNPKDLVRLAQVRNDCSFNFGLWRQWGKSALRSQRVISERLTLAHLKEPKMMRNLTQGLGSQGTRLFHPQRRRPLHYTVYTSVASDNTAEKRRECEERKMGSKKATCRSQITS